MDGSSARSAFAGDSSPWLIVEEGFAPALANTFEALFTTGNGYLVQGLAGGETMRGLPGTFLRGVFDHHDSAVIDLVKAPDWLSLGVVANGTRLDVTSASVRHHRRVLDMRDATLSRETVFEDSEGRRTRVESVRFASAADQHLCCLQVRITPENHDASIALHSGIDGTGYNLDRLPLYTVPPPADPQMKWQKWAKSKHLEEVVRSHSGEGIYRDPRSIPASPSATRRARPYPGRPSPRSASGTSTSNRCHVLVWPPVRR
jgi:hypothetical protein